MNAPLPKIVLDDQPVLKTVIYRGQPWDLSHLDSYGFYHDGPDGEILTVVVVFSCHCFTREPTKDELAQNSVSPEDWYDDGKEKRVLDVERYQLSLQYLPSMVKTLASRHIVIGDENRKQGNFVTVEVQTSDGNTGYYSLFFEVTKQKKRRLILRVQTAYVRPAIPKREKEAKPVKLKTLLNRTFERKKIKP